MKQLSPKGTAKAFTVVELLVAAAILALLAALLIPGLDHTPTRAPISHCMNNLRQVGLALQLASGAKVDFDGIYYETGGSSYVAIQGFDHLAVTDAKGEFVLTSEKAFASTGVTVEAHGLARLPHLIHGHFGHLPTVPAPS